MAMMRRSQSLELLPARSAVAAPVASSFSTPTTDDEQDDEDEGEQEPPHPLGTDPAAGPLPSSAQPARSDRSAAKPAKSTSRRKRVTDFVMTTLTHHHHHHASSSSSPHHPHQQQQQHAPEPPSPGGASATEEEKEEGKEEEEKGGGGGTKRRHHKRGHSLSEGVSRLLVLMPLRSSSQLLSSSTRAAEERNVPHSHPPSSEDPARPSTTGGKASSKSGKKARRARSQSSKEDRSPNSRNKIDSRSGATAEIPKGLHPLKPHATNGHHQATSPPRPNTRVLGDPKEWWDARKAVERESDVSSTRPPVALNLQATQHGTAAGSITPPVLSPRERKEFLGRARTLTSPQSSAADLTATQLSAGTERSGSRRGPQALTFEDEDTRKPGDATEAASAPSSFMRPKHASTQQHAAEPESEREGAVTTIHAATSTEEASKSNGSANMSTGEERVVMATRTVQDFEFGRVLGEGSYGQVRAARDTATGLVLAVKILDKRHVVKMGKVEQVKQEKQILHSLSHPNIIHLYCTFQDLNSLFFVMEYCPNGELHRHLKRLGSFNFECTQFYIAELISALEYLHSRGIMHRDIKPQNMLLDANYHLKLIDFGTAKYVGPEHYARSTSFVGTAEYVAPELLNEHYSVKSSDLWALGCVLYQFLAGKSPFRGSNDYKTFRKIKEMKLKFPKGFPTVARDLVQRLLVPDWTQRLDYAHLKAHPFFHGVDWATLHTTPPPVLAAPSVPVFVDEEKEKKLRAQEAKSSVWGKFLFKNSDEVIVQTDPVVKISKHFFGASKSPKKRQLILTDFPRLFYVDIDKMAQLGEIEWRPDMHVEARNSDIFEITSGESTYVFEAEGRANRWCRAIARLLRKSNGDDITDEDMTHASSEAITEASSSASSGDELEESEAETSSDAHTNSSGAEKSRRRHKQDRFGEHDEASSGGEGSGGRGVHTTPQEQHAHKEKKRRSGKESPPAHSGRTRQADD